MGFYQALFPAGTISSEDFGWGSEKGSYTPILVRIQRDAGRDSERAERHTILDGLSRLETILSVDSAMPGTFDLISPVTYAGRRPLLTRAHDLRAVAIDLDGVQIEDGHPVGLVDLLYQMTAGVVDGQDVPARLPTPTFIVSSGTGLHLYYVLDKPLRLWPNVIEALTVFRNALTRRVWNSYVTDYYRDDEVQLESVIQGFRAVGSLAKDGHQVVRAFRTGDHVGWDYLNDFVPPDARLTGDVLHATHTLEEARALWPDWDPDWRVKRSAAAAKPYRWHVKRDLYDWWCRRVERGDIREGHRYWSIFVAACCAAKCPDVSYEELESWAHAIRPRLDRLTTRAGNEFTPADVEKALAAYGNPLSWRIRRDKIKEKCGVEMPVNKRNFQRQRDHLEEARAIRDLRQKRAGTVWSSDNSRKGCPNKSYPKRDAILAYAAEHPDASQREIAAALGMSKTTVNKWLKSHEEEEATG